MGESSAVDLALSRAAREVALENAAQAVQALRTKAPPDGDLRAGYLAAVEDAVRMIRSLATPPPPK